MKISPLSKKFIILTTLLSITNISNANAWSGYDYDNKVEIEIGSGNLVREGLMIQFYDEEDNSYHPAKVLLMESIAGGTRIEVEDLDNKKNRVFIMEE